MPLPGYTRLPGKANRYRTPSGDEISRRQYENLRFQKLGYSSWSEYQREAKSKEFKRFAAAAADEHETNARKIKTDPEFTELYLAAKRSDWQNDPEGPFADFLVYIGLRRPDADYNVGDTP